ncbi:hypothetical protein PM082_011815 [Marasmius tenuissimus]|nr:hypothetical protein PM082_011815 [Marasmius tenuissimus]
MATVQSSRNPPVKRLRAMDEGPHPTIKKQKAEEGRDASEHASEDPRSTDQSTLKEPSSAQNTVATDESEELPTTMKACKERRQRLAALEKAKEIENAIANNDYGPSDSRVYFQVISALESLIEVQEEVQEVYDLMTNEDLYRDDKMTTFLTKEKRESVENQFKKRTVEDYLICRAHNARVESVHRRIRRVEGVEEAIRKMRTNLRLIRERVRVYDRHIPAICKAGDSRCCWKDHAREEAVEIQDVHEYFHKHYFYTLTAKLNTPPKLPFTERLPLDIGGSSGVKLSRPYYGAQMNEQKDE